MSIFSKLGHQLAIDKAAFAVLPKKLFTYPVHGKTLGEVYTNAGKALHEETGKARIGFLIAVVGLAYGLHHWGNACIANGTKMTSGQAIMALANKKEG